MSNHFSGPDLRFPGDDARLDITDLYAFPKPGQADATVLVMDVCPSVSINPPGPTSADGLAAEAAYEFRIDTDGDAVANIVYGVRCSAPVDGQQTATLYRAEGDVVTATTGGEVILADVPVALGADAPSVEAGGHRLFVGRRSDPFFADVTGALNGLQFTGADSLADVDVYAIVLEVPNAALGPRSHLGIWATVRTPVQADTGQIDWVQIDRAGRPEMVNFYCQGEDKIAYNAGEPAHDRTRFLDGFAHALEHMGHYPPHEARTVAAGLLPDMLPYDVTRPAALPESGRALTDDAFDQALSVYIQRPISDGVGPHTDLLADFPYLGPPHHPPRRAATPSAAAQATVG